MRKKHWILVLAAMCCLCFLSAEVALAVNGDKSTKKASGKYVDGEVIVKFKDGTSDSVIANVKKQHGLSDIGPKKKKGIARVRIPDGTTVEQALESLKKEPSVKYAEPNYRITFF
jgi:phage tail protein X